MIKKLFFPAFLICLLNFAFAFRASAAESILIDRGRVDPVPIAINHSLYRTSKERKISEKILHIIKTDLESCAMFRTINPESFIDNQKGAVGAPLFEAWRQINTRLLLNTTIKKSSSSKFDISLSIWDVPRAKKLRMEKITFSDKNLRPAAHKISNIIYKIFTGSNGYFNSKITYCAESGTLLKRKKQIAIMDQDGMNHKYLTDISELSILPKFSPCGKFILYISYRDKISNAYLINIETQKKLRLNRFIGDVCSANFSPDGKKILLAIAFKGSTHLYEFDIKSKRKRQLTYGYGINVSGSYSPDGSKIVFNSNRAGSRQIYIMNPDGTDVQRVSFGGGSYASPCWSPKGDYIAFTKIDRDYGFTIGLMRANAQLNMILQDERIIASGYLVEDPSFSPDGRSILFSSSKLLSSGNLETKLHIISFTGRGERVLQTPLDGSAGYWSNNFDN